MSQKNLLVKQQFSKVLGDLLLTKEFEDISAADIIKQSGLSKATFYRHFHDKYELANWKFRTLMDGLKGVVVSGGETEDLHLEILRFIDRNRPEFKRLFKYTSQNSIREYYMQETFDWAHVHSKAEDKELFYRDYYTLIYCGNGFMAAIEEWLKSDDPISPEQLNSIISSNRTDVVRDLFVAR